MKRKYLLLLSKVEEKWFHIENTEEIFRLGNKEQEHNSEEKTCQEIVYLFCSECDKMQQQKMRESVQHVPQIDDFWKCSSVSRIPRIPAFGSSATTALS